MCVCVLERERKISVYVTVIERERGKDIVGFGCGSVAPTPEVHSSNPVIGKIYIQYLLLTVFKRDSECVCV